MGIPSQLNPDKDPSRLYDEVEYKDYWKGIQKDKLNELEQALVHKLLPVRGHHLIDIGCGYGRMAETYLNRFDQVAMLDGSMSLLRQAQMNTDRRALYIAGDANHLPFRPATFDAVIMIRVFHHIPDSLACLREFHRVLCEAGLLVFTYRNKRDLLTIMKWLLRRIPFNPFTLKPADLDTTLIRHHPKYIKQILDKAGFINIENYGAGVIDKFTKFSGAYAQKMPAGLATAGILGRTGTAPWMFSKANVHNGTVQETSTSLEELLVCPVCQQSLEFVPNAYRCLKCERLYPIDDGIIDFRME